MRRGPRLLSRTTPNYRLDLYAPPDEDSFTLLIYYVGKWGSDVAAEVEVEPSSDWYPEGATEADAIAWTKAIRGDMEVQEILGGAGYDQYGNGRPRSPRVEMRDRGRKRRKKKIRGFLTRVRKQRRR